MYGESILNMRLIKAAFFVRRRLINFVRKKEIEDQEDGWSTSFYIPDELDLLL